MPVLNENIGAFNSYVESLKLHFVFHSLYMLVYFVLNNGNTAQISVLLHFLVHTNSSNILYLHLTDE